MRTVLVGWALCAVLTACSEETTEPPLQGWLDTQTDELPSSLSELGLQPNPDEPAALHPRVVAYEPQWPLWSNGSLKERLLFLPAGTQIDTEGEAWRLPVGSVLTKTFRFETDGAIETRVLWHKAEDDWEYAGYLWKDDGSDAELLELRRGIEVPVTGEGGEAFEHRVPNRLDCRTCHESNSSSPVLGLNAWQLSAQAMADLQSRGMLAGAPQTQVIEGPDEPTTQVMGYVMGNCSHCHNGEILPDTSSAYDLRYPVFLEQTINVRTDNSVSLPGIRVVPGDPDGSILYRAFAGDYDEAESAAAMPPIGIELRDAAMASTLRDWIRNLEAP